MESPCIQADASSSSSIRWSFDVFLSFRGEDTRFNFTSHLDMALRQRGINVFIDYNLSRGENISTSLLKAIEESKISIVVISENYASSSWCLDELVKIIECWKSKGQVVFPVFYKIDPSDVRKQSGSIGEALAKHQVKHMDKMEAWKEALAAIPHLSGWVLKEGIEADLIQKIVEEVLAKLNRRAILHVARYPIGIDSQIQAMNSLFHVMSDCITTIGIYGIGGMGKTTLAKALYNKIANQFEGSTFLSNVREASNQYGGLIQLQEILLSEILMCNLKVGNIDKGISIISDRLRSKKILIVLDDIDELQQLQALAGRRDWFGQGSKIIVTTRNKHILSIHEFDVQHHIQKLPDDQALELFSWHAFKQNQPLSGYLDLSKRAVDYCKGLPLALAVLGSFFYNRSVQSDWKDILDGYEKSSLDKDIRNILQISYDELEDQVKEIFLNISCLFIGLYIDKVEKMLEACGNLYPKKGIEILMDLSLLTIHKNRVEMHELVRQLGQTIALLESSTPRKRKRLWIADDILDLLRSEKGTNAVKAIKLNYSDPTEFNLFEHIKFNFDESMELDIDAEAFRYVEDLRLLMVEKVTLSKDLEYLPNNLKWIDWSEFPCSSLPPSYNPTKLTTLKLVGSSIKQFGIRFMNFESLKHVDLSHSQFLEEIPDFSTAANLEILSAVFCRNLIKVHESIGSLGKLALLSLPSCFSLEQFPSYLKLKSLKDLNLRSCSRLQQFPEIGEEMKSLKDISIDLSCTAIETVPPSIGYLTGLEKLNLSMCENLITLPTTIHCLSSLRSLHLSGCKNLITLPTTVHCLSGLPSLNHGSCSNLSSFPRPSSKILPHLLSNLQSLNLNFCNIQDTEFLEAFSHVTSSLEELYLFENKLSSLPSSIDKFTSLKHLDVRGSKLLQAIPRLPTCIEHLNTNGCISLARFPDNIVDVISHEREYYKDRKWHFRLITLMNSDIPKWYRHQSKGNSITFQIPYHPSRKLRALVPCLSFRTNKHPTCEVIDDLVCIKCKIFINNFEVWANEDYENCTRSTFKNMLWILVIDPQTRGWDIVLKAWRDVMEGEYQCDCTVSFEAQFDGGISIELFEETYKEMVTIRSCGVHYVIDDEECDAHEMGNDDNL